MSLRTASILLLLAALSAGCASTDDPELADIAFAGELVDEDGAPLPGDEWAIPFETLLEAAERRLDAYRVNPAERLPDLADATAAMEALFRTFGHDDALVSFRCEPSETEPERVVFEVHAGVRSYLALAPEIVFEARNPLHVPNRHKEPEFVPVPARYEAEKATLEQWLVPPEGGPFGGEDDSYQEARAQAGASRAKTWYRLKGHPFVAVTVTATKLTKDEIADLTEPPGGDQPLKLVLTVRRGPAVLVDGFDLLDWEPREALRAEVEAIWPKLLSRVDAKDTLPWHPRTGTDISASLREVLRAHGHLQADVSVIPPDIGPPPSAETARSAQTEGEDLVLIPADRIRRLQVRVDPGPVHRLAEPVRITGLERTEEDFIRNRLHLEVGERVDGARLDETIEEVYETGLFSLATLRRTDPENTLPAEDGVDQVETGIELALQELEARSFDVEVGYGSYELARTRLRYRDRNFLDIGRELDATTWASLRSYGAGVRFIDPWILGRRWTVETGASFDFRQNPSFDSTSLSFDAKLRRRLDTRDEPSQRFIEFGYQFTARSADADVVDPRQLDDSGFVISAGIFVNWNRDSRDNALLPKNGSLQQVGVFLSRPEFGAELSFVELRLFDAHHWELEEDQRVLAVGGRFVTRHILDDEVTLPIQERLFLGGESTVRGFCEDGLGPADASGEALGGLTTFFASIELRERISGDLWGAVFYDVGTVGNEDFDLMDGWGHTVGFGLRYYLPFGPIRADIGINPGRTFGNDDTWALHVAFGFSF